MLTYHHVDVFADRPYTGNSLAVFVDPPPLDARQMLAITQELRHFETVFVWGGRRIRIFDLFEELPFAGHPVLGAAAVLHELSGQAEWAFELAAGTVRVTTSGRTAVMDQQGARFVRDAVPAEGVAAALGLAPGDLDGRLPLQVVSTGLPYLIVPVAGDALARARISRPDFDLFLQQRAAQFAYLLDADRLEGRHWNNDGVIEDVATASAAGCIGAYLLRNGRVAAGQEFALAQGRFVGRPSRILVTPHEDRVTVGGTVAMVGTGTLRELP
ncbi:PhzF family phenazine biosynthesis protein [Nonomuraea guangzhouensis]|uniref:PhzF family phenazine biosynthesis protein n=1 Tax=Nonomuraea guangzhouensis TaxID=1291555 RepID=A0ABW4G4G3_9ACTN|nr:PhzF family phenazine biosynthesis protein [Nonomuraea guangzhouensis]